MEAKVVELFDAHGTTSKMVKIPRFNWEDVSPALGKGVHDAFIVRSGAILDEICIGAHQAVVEKGAACVIAKDKNTTNITFDEARAACAAMGSGWHLLTAWEYSAMVLWCLMTGEMPFSFFWWEWVDLLKLVNGRFLFPEQNAIGLPEALWPSHEILFDADKEKEPIISDHIHKRLGKIGSDDYGAYGYLKSWKDLQAAPGYAEQHAAEMLLLCRLLIAPIDDIADKITGSLWMRNYGECLPIRGGNWDVGSVAGLAYLNLSSRRSDSSVSVGLRPAFIPPENLDSESLEH